MTYCDVCHSRIYTYKTFKIGPKTACYHCKIKHLEQTLEDIKDLLPILDRVFQDAETAINEFRGTPENPPEECDRQIEENQKTLDKLKELLEAS